LDCIALIQTQLYGALSSWWPWGWSASRVGLNFKLVI